MQIIPVLDLMGGLVVRGVMGDRANYRPIASRLVASAEPLAVAKALQALGGFATFYIADLDAIEGSGSQGDIVSQLAAAMPGTEFWVDAGFKGLAEVEALWSRPGVAAVIGSESVDGLSTIAALTQNPRAILSLDYRGEAFVGPVGLDLEADLWPSRIIAMTLAKVGSGAGPDFDRLRAVSGLAGGRAVFAAGGVRDAADLDRLAQEGVAGVLVASALHDGRLDAAALARFGQIA